jgi:hypothetical protein
MVSMKKILTQRLFPAAAILLALGIGSNSCPKVGRTR